jgi:hypothetical protein
MKRRRRMDDTDPWAVVFALGVLAGIALLCAGGI